MNDEEKRIAEGILRRIFNSADNDELKIHMALNPSIEFFVGAMLEYASLVSQKTNDGVDRVKLQKAYDEIWKTQIYPAETKGKPKGDDILRKYFPDLKPDDERYLSTPAEIIKQK